MYKLNKEKLICINGGPEETNIDNRLILLTIRLLGKAGEDDPRRMALNNVRAGMETADGDGDGIFGRAPEIGPA